MTEPVPAGEGYASQYSRQRDMAKHPRLLTDRNAYMSFLEQQLERVSAACLTAQAFDARITQLGEQAVGLEDKLLNVGKLVKLSHAYMEEASAESARRDAVLAERCSRMEQLLGGNPQIAQGPGNGAEDSDGRVEIVAADVDALRQDHEQRLRGLESAVARAHDGIAQLESRPAEAPAAPPAALLDGLRRAEERAAAAQAELERRLREAEAAAGAAAGAASAGEERALRALRPEIAALESRVSAAQQRASAARDEQASQLSQLRAAVSELSSGGGGGADVRELRDTCGRLQAATREMAELSMAKSRERASEVMDAVERLEHRIAALEAGAPSAPSPDADLPRLAATLSAMASRMDRLRAENADLRERLGALERTGRRPPARRAAASPGAAAPPGPGGSPGAAALAWPGEGEGPGEGVRRSPLHFALGDLGDLEDLEGSPRPPFVVRRVRAAAGLGASREAREDGGGALSEGAEDAASSVTLGTFRTR